MDRYAGDATIRWYGLYPAIVDDIVDPDNLGRIKVKFPSFGSAGQDATCWATLLSIYADNNQGWQILPEVGSQVVVGFEAGDPTRGYIVGACWNGRASLPESPQRANDKRLLRTRSGSELMFDDGTTGAKVTLKTGGGHKLEFDDVAGNVVVTHSNGCEIRMNIAGQVTINANATVEVNASAVNVHAPMVTCDGLLQCQTLITQSVVSPMYTPGAGNVW